MKKSILVIGVGNVLLKDEGVGIHVIQRIQAHGKTVFSKYLADSISWPVVEFITGGTSGLNILEQLENREKIIIIDAAHTKDPPGTLYRFTLNDLKTFQPGEKLSAHNINLHDVLNLLVFLHKSSIPAITIMAVNVKDTTMGEYLSNEVENRIPDIIELIFKECTSSSTHMRT